MNTVPLSNALAAIQTPNELTAFLKDLCTPQELHAMEERWRVCQLLHSQQHSYREVHGLTGASLATITRVARFLKNENHGGYRLILGRLPTKSSNSQKSKAKPKK